MSDNDTNFVDACGLICPLPVLKLRKFLQDVPKGEVVVLKATDPNTPKDTELFCQEMGYVFQGVVEDNGVYTITIQTA